MHWLEIKLIQKLTSSCLVLLCLYLTSCATAPWEKSKYKNLPPESRALTSAKDFELNPESTKARKEMVVNKESAENELLTQAEKARQSGDIEGTTKLYEKILSFSPNNQSAISALKEIESEKKLAKKLEKASDMLAKNQLQAAKDAVREVLLEQPNSKQAKTLNEQIDEKIGAPNIKPPKLKPLYDTPITLELRDANIKVVFDALSRATGINFILDKDIKPDTKTTIFIKKLPIAEAIQMVLSSSGLQKKDLSETTALVYPSNLQKLKEYQDLIIRSFYLNNTSAKQVSAMLKTMLKTKDIFVDDRLNMIVMRDTPEAIRVAERLIAGNDLADPEVMLEIEVLEVSRSRLQELGIRYPEQLRILGANDVLRLRELNNISSSSVGVSPNPALNIKKTTGDVNLLSNPRIRVKNNEKAKILVGDKVPIITTTSTANVGVSENVTYVDVGLKLDVEPRITLDDFVNIKVGLEVSSLGERTTTTNGATVFTIGTRNANTSLRLKDGETQVLAGLISDEERKNTNRLPGIGDIPLLGRLFSNQEDRKNKTEIVLVITPRIINNIQLPKAEVSEYLSGTENQISDTPIGMSPQSSSSGEMSPSDRLQQLREERLRLRQNQEQAPANEAPKVAPENSGNTMPNTNAGAPAEQTIQIAPSNPEPSDPNNSQQPQQVIPNIDPNSNIRF
jgi:general secretion pathway protein D